jgi:hypothetical protein
MKLQQEGKSTAEDSEDDVVYHHGSQSTTQRGKHGHEATVIPGEEGGVNHQEGQKTDRGIENDEFETDFTLGDELVVDHRKGNGHRTEQPTSTTIAKQRQQAQPKASSDAQPPWIKPC